MQLSQINIPSSHRREWLCEHVAPKQVRVWIDGAGGSCSVYLSPVISVPELALGNEAQFAVFTGEKLKGWYQ